jgi:CRISPR-associated protein Cmr1
MISRTYRVSFVTPAFLGGADQSAQWRVPPFKALLRQWWRVVWWNTSEPNSPDKSLERLKSEEGRLFGWAADDKNKSCRAQIRMTLGHWNPGQLPKGAFDEGTFNSVQHPEAPKNPSSATYLGFGPVGPGAKSGKRLRSCIAAGASNRLTISCPREDLGPVEEALKLAAIFGSVGGRARNGWGSVWIEPDNSAKQAWPTVDNLFANIDSDEIRFLYRYSEIVEKALDLDWCHAIGKSNKGLLIWYTEEQDRWEQVFDILAQVKINFRVKPNRFKFPEFSTKEEIKTKSHWILCDRHLISYPVTRHPYRFWEKTHPSKQALRNANQILFKVVRVQSMYRGIVVHLVHGLPRVLVERLRDSDKKDIKKRQLEVWDEIHSVLNKNLKPLS